MTNFVANANVSIDTNNKIADFLSSEARENQKKISEKIENTILNQDKFKNSINEIVENFKKFGRSSHENVMEQLKNLDSLYPSKEKIDIVKKLIKKSILDAISEGLRKDLEDDPRFKIISVGPSQNYIAPSNNQGNKK
ncbi:hypothetical protein HE1_00079 [Holospora elegans E1]|uniref:Uncharacterized protein n=1 Tax=Holospora elegans E1 TaxID=1427503 RepID=A0A023DXV1_9PROT|nr:hypothetical protein [Holospora elegans]GAJ45770.1 hypothetical protein HE1_00079 [Holospora elegans E1]